jgi:hypothetical protein
VTPDDRLPIESIKRLDVRPGDTLVFTVPAGLNCEEHDLIRQSLKAYLPDSITWIVVTADVTLSVVSPEGGG